MLRVISDSSSDFLVMTHSCVQHCNVLVSAWSILLTTGPLTPLGRIVVKTLTFDLSVDTRFYSAATIVLIVFTWPKSAPFVELCSSFNVRSCLCYLFLTALLSP